MIQLLIDNPLLLLFLVAAVGYLVGRIKIGGVNLGVAAVLFVGIAAGALHPDLKLPEIIYILGAGSVRLHRRPEQRGSLLCFVPG